MASRGYDNQTYDLFSKFLSRAKNDPNDAEPLDKLCQHFMLKFSNDELLETVDSLKSMAEHMLDVNTKLAARELGPRELVEHPLFGRALRARMKTLPPSALKISPKKRAAPARPSFVCRQRKISFSLPKTPRKKSGSASSVARVQRTRGYSRNIGVQVHNKPSFMICVHSGCKFEDYSRAKMKHHYLSKHGIDYGDTPLPIYELQLQNVEERRVGKGNRCVTCAKKYETDEELSYHTRTVHVPDQFKAHKCNCGQKFVMAVDLKKHMKSCIQN